MSSHTPEHSVLIALRELDSLEQQRRDDEAARERARLAAAAKLQAEAEARIAAESAARARAEAEAEAAAAAERERRAHELHLRNREIEAHLQREQAARLQRVQSEIDVKLRSHSRRELAGQRVIAAVLLAVLGLAGAIGGMLLTRPRPGVVDRAVAAARDLREMAALQEYAAAIDEMEQDLGRMRGANAKQEAVIEAAAALRAMIAAKEAADGEPVARPKPPKTPRPAGKTPPGIKKPGTQVAICKTDDPLAEDCP